MEKSGIFNSINRDRLYGASFFAEYFSSFIANGVFPNPSTGLQVIANSDMTVTIKAGKGWINGYYYCNTDDLILNIDVADGVLYRIDTVVLRYDTVSREIKAVVKKGFFASEPIPTVLKRDADAYELGIADIEVKAGAIYITQADITDLRLNKEFCGIVHGTVDQVDTTAIFNQFQSWYSQTKEAYEVDINQWTTEKKQAFDTWYIDNTTAFMEQFTNWFGLNTTTWENNFNDWYKNTQTWENDFDVWFATLKNKLDGDVAAKLTADVTALTNRANDLETSTSSNTDSITENSNKIGSLTTGLDEFKTSTNEQLADIIQQQSNIIQQQFDITLTASNWTDDTATSGFWVYRVNDTDITDKTIVDFAIHLSHLAKADGMINTTQSFAGYYNFYAEKQLTEDIILDMKKTTQAGDL